MGEEQARTVKELSWGRDSAEVKMSGRVASIGLEDRFKSIEAGLSKPYQLNNLLYLNSNNIKQFPV